MLVDGGAALLNIILDYWFIFGGLGLFPGGIAGAAIATVLSFYAKVIVYFYLFLRPKNRAAYDVHRFEYRPKLFRRLLQFGGPSGVQFFLEAGGFTVFVLLVGRLGQTELAATNMAFNVSSFAFMPVFGFGTAASILVGTRLGAGEPILASRAVWTTAIISFVYMGVISAGYVLLPDLFLLGLSEQQQGDNRQAIKEISIVLLRYVAAYNLFDAMNIIFVSAIKGAGDTRFVMFTSLAMGMVLGVGTWVGLQWFDFRLHGCWIWVTVWVCVLGGIYLARFQNGNWRSMRVIEPNLIPVAHNVPSE
jgi:MATE family multidrug resistance protein